MTHVSISLDNIITTAAKRLSEEEINQFEDTCKDIAEKYFSKYSAESNLEFSRLPKFSAWLQNDPLFSIGRNKIVPLIVSKMMHGDPLALQIYSYIYRDEEEKILTIEEIIEDPRLEEEFIKYGMSLEGESVLNAKHWLGAPEGHGFIMDYIGDYNSIAYNITEGDC